MSRHRMDNADAAWLRMDRPTNLMVVNSVMWFDEPLALDEISKVLQERLTARFPRFSQKVVQEHGIWWEDVADFDIDRHLRTARLPAPASRIELERFVASKLTLPLDPELPLWEMYLVENYQGGSALFFRMHHCIADGIALVRVLLSLTDEPGAEPVQVAPPDDGERRGLAGQLTGLLTGLAHGALDTVIHPSHLVDLAQTGWDDSAALAKLLLLPPDHRTSLHGRSGLDKEVVWSDPIPLDRVKQASKSAGVTINDLLLTAVAGALRSHLERQGGAPRDFRAIVPFNLRPLDKPLPAELGNKFGLVFLTLPIQVEDRAERLAEMSRRMTSIKHSAEGPVAYGILEVVGQTPLAVEGLIVDIFASKGTAVMTNVPGPRQTVYLAGHPLRGTMGWVPMSGDIGLGVSIFSYAGEITVGLSVDSGLVPEVQLLLDGFMAELHLLTGAKSGG